MPPALNSDAQTSLAETLQVCCLSRRSGQIIFRSGESSGFVYLQHGRVIHAVCGPLEGDEAIYRMLSWPPGGYSLNEDILPHEKTIILTWEQLLLEGARRVDQGIDSARSATVPIVTATPATSSRVRHSLPKITLTLPDERPRVYELEAEYTHVGRASGNEVPLSDASVSNRHCIFILNGSDVVLRDLNSSNGTIVNGQAITEVILRPGDLIQVGVVQMKFEPAVRRPKLTQTAAASPFGAGSQLTEVLNREPSKSTIKLPQAVSRAKPEEIKGNTAFLKGESAISYDNLPKPEDPAKAHSLLLIIGAVIIVLAVAGGCYYYFTTYPR